MEKAHHPIKSGSFVNIVHFENFNAIYIRDASYEYLEMFYKFNLKLKQYYKQSMLLMNSLMEYIFILIFTFNFEGGNLCVKEMVNIGDKVCVNTQLNQVMYCRALVLEKFGNEYNVFNVDFGNKELVNSNDIFELPEEFEKVCIYIFIDIFSIIYLTLKINV